MTIRRARTTAGVAALLALASGFTAAAPRIARAPLAPLAPGARFVPLASRATLPVVEANDNRQRAGVMHRDTLYVSLDVRMARWYPEAPGGEYIEGPVIGEVGHTPQIPGPLLRVVEGTVVVARLTNALPDSSLTWYGLDTRPGADSVKLRPGETTTMTFRAGQPGTYLYAAVAGKLDWNKREREQAAGALVVDARGTRTDDRVFVINIWSEPIDSLNGRNALAINGKGWPFTERVVAARGDTLRWRIVNASVRPHPMHLHGFYYRILAQGSFKSDSTYTPADRRTVVTGTMEPFSTMRMEWVAEREGNWLFHCHLSFHVAADTRFTSGAGHADHMSGDVNRHMAGLVLGIEVKPGRAVATREPRRNPRALRLLVQEGRRHGRAPRALGFVLQRGAPPAADSVEIPGSPLILTRGQPTDITVVNQLNEATAVHWHGIELESWSDGVAGWSGAMNRLAPAIAPRDSFTARLTLRRAGTFIYHTHLNDVVQLTSGMYGPLLVLEPGQKYDPATDHLFVVGWDGPDDPPHLVVNGDSLPAPLVLQAGVHHRMRFVFIGVVGGEQFTLRSAAGPATWRALAQDGFEYPASRQVEIPAKVTGWAGQTFDFDFYPTAPGEYTLVATSGKRTCWEGKVIVR